MRRVCLLVALTIVGATSMYAAARQPSQPSQPAPPPLRLEKLADTLYVLHGGCVCGNTTFYLTDEGVVMVDTKVAGLGPEILKQLRTVTDKPIAMIINTHTHFDHTGSNAEFGAVGRIVAHANARASLTKATCEPVTNCQAFKGENAKYLPNVTYEDTRTLTSGKDEIRLHYFGPGHTDGDAWIVFPALRVALLGDLFGAKSVPFIDRSNGGTALAFADTIAKGVAGIKDVDTVISGHVDAYPWKDLVRYIEFLEHLRDVALAGKQAGRSVEEVAGAYKVPASLSDFSTIPMFMRGFVQAVYDESTAK